MAKISEQSETPQSLWRDFVRTGLPALLIAALLLSLQNDAVRHTLFDLQSLRHSLRGGDIPGGIYSSMVVFLFGFGILIGIGVPRLWVSAAAGAIYGAIPGFFLALLASVLGAVIIYKLGETLLSSFLLNRFNGKIESWAQRFRENAFWWVLYIRLFPFANASITGVLCGCSKVPLQHYLAGSTLGFVPLTIVFATFGSGGMSGSYHQIALGFGLLALSIAMRYLVKLSRKNPLADQTPVECCHSGKETR